MKALVAAQSMPELKDAFSKMLSGCLEHPDQREWYAVWNIELNDGSKTVIGILSFKGLNENGTVEIGYGTNPGFERRGYMTEAVLAVVHWASAQDGVKSIEAETEADNTASKRVLEKAGFVLTEKPGKRGQDIFGSLDNGSEAAMNRIIFGMDEASLTFIDNKNNLRGLFFLNVLILNGSPKSKGGASQNQSRLPA